MRESGAQPVAVLPCWLAYRDTGAAQTLKKIQQKLAISETNEKQFKCIEEAVELVYGFPAKKDQVQSLHSLLVRKEDRILIAKTGYGKSVVPQLLPLLSPDSIVLIILPLNALGAEQLVDIEKLPLANPVWLHADNNDESMLRRIAAGLYTHILVSPEIACSLKFCDQVVSQTLFRKRLRAVVVDEVHLVVDWGRSFRKAYSLLKHFRNRIGQKPWFGCTATFDPGCFDELCRYIGFKKSVRVIRTGIDRPEIAYIRKVIRKNQKMQFRYLYFVIENAVKDARPTPSRIPKTLIFFESKKIMRKCMYTIRKWLREKNGYSLLQNQLPAARKISPRGAGLQARSPDGIRESWREFWQSSV